MQLQTIHSKQAKQVYIEVYVLADSKTFYSVSSKIYAEAGTQIPVLLVSTHEVMDLIQPISWRNRNITTDNL